MQERIAEYVDMLKAKGIKSLSDYETPARVCAEYFDVRGIDMPTADDWTAFKEHYREIYRREKGKDISETTLQQNYVARGKAFYKWSNGQQTASLFEAEPTEAITAPVLYEEGRPNEAEKHGENVRVNFLLSKEHHSALMSVAYLKDKTLTAILTEAIKAYIQGYSEDIATLEETRRKFRSK